MANLAVLVFGIVAFILMIAEGDSTATTLLSKLLAVVCGLTAWVIYHFVIETSNK